ncbi:DUF1156 domain-containing protein [Iamia sp. SCSIO 61187]|uniref:DUF1156 domain-containing protein n=1 Tax=Iamia sp. SCSIO 61187 TaxID=2722752 RepID=UPI001C6356B8|nr:DUF1156 domain-containing protein [Iamia sp. SCSIO 61187]QYG91814.1 DUF1156 domain-containing protein [Iamia sp. SCSIO 61187]
MYKKKLIEVAIPLEAINAACKLDKDRKTGTIRNLHKWFAPMPTPALRALIFASLVDDPEDDTERLRLMDLVSALVGSVVDTPPASVMAEVTASINDSVGSDPPTVLDPFCGGGSTLVEAQRLGLPSRGSDLNPIPVLISTVLTSLPPSLVNRPPAAADFLDPQALWSGLSGYLADIDHYGRRVYNEAKERIGNLYPPAPNGDTTVAWIWARTVPSPDPRLQGASVPLVSNWWLSKKDSERAYVEPVINDDNSVDFIVRSIGEPPSPSKSACVVSGAPISFKYLREQGSAGNLGTTLIALAANGLGGRTYHSPNDVHRNSAAEAKPLDPPELMLPDRAIGFRVQGYGLREWSELFTNRQLVALETFADLVAQVPQWVRHDGGDEDQAQGIAAILGLCVGKLAQFSSSQCLWKIDSRNGTGKAESAKFGRNDVPMSWDFVETNPFGGSVGDWLQIIQTSTRALDCVEPAGPASQVVQGDARTAGVDLAGQCLVVTDPPYFSAIGYANLSDYFYPWIRRALSQCFPDLLGTFATPKGGELIAEPARHESEADAKTYFITGFTETFRSLQSASRPDLPLLVVYAFKEQEGSGGASGAGGWEAMLEAIMRSDLMVVATWPVHGTGSTRMRGLGANALATYVVLVCRPRPAGSGQISRTQFLSELRSEIGASVRVLQAAGIAPVDLAQAVIGPGMGVFTRYSAVVAADGSRLSVRDAQIIVNSVFAEVMGEQESDWDGETRWAVTWYEQFQYTVGTSGEADALARAKVTSLDRLDRAGIVETGSSRTRLLTRDELPESYDVATDANPTCWEAVQHLIKALETGGEEAAAKLLSSLSDADAARELAYGLYLIANEKGMAKEAAAMNALVVTWPELARLASSMGLPEDPEAQGRLL